MPLSLGIYKLRRIRNNLDIPLTIAVTLTLSVAMLWPMDQPPPAPEGSDELVHFIAFATLAFPLARTGRYGLLPVFVGASAFGGIIELIQPSFNRSADVNDWVADIFGVVLGIGCDFRDNGQRNMRERPHRKTVFIMHGLAYAYTSNSRKFN